MNSSEYGRRDVIKRAAAAGLLAVPGSALLAACATGGSGSSGGGAKGTKSNKNPLGVSDTANLETVIFNGGFGYKYMQGPLDGYKKEFPKVKKTTLTPTQNIQQMLQPRFAQGNPPDLIDNDGAQAMATATLASQGQLSSLDDLLDAPSYDDPSKKVRDTLRPGVAEVGQFGSSTTYALMYQYTTYGTFYSSKLMKQHGWEFPETWDKMLALCAEIKKAGIAPWAYAGKYPNYVHFIMFPMMAKIGGPDVLKAIDNLEPNAFKNPAGPQAAEMMYELRAKGYMLKGTEGMTHIQSQTAWTQYKCVFIPDGSWVENEAKPTTPADFGMTCAAPTGNDSSDKMPYPATRAEAGGAFIVPAKAKNANGGKELLRLMLSKKYADANAKTLSTLTAFNDTPSFQMPSGMASVAALLAKMGTSGLITWRLGDWYQKLEQQQIGNQLTGPMMRGDIKPADWVKKAQAFADQTAKDSSIKKFKR